MYLFLKLIRKVGRQVAFLVAPRRRWRLRPKHGRPVGPKLVVGRGLKRRRPSQALDDLSALIIGSIAVAALVAIVLAYTVF